MKHRTITLALTLLAGALIAFGIHRVTRGKSAPDPGVTVYVFLAEDCPISQSATLALKSLYHEFHSPKTEFVGVFANAAPRFFLFTIQ